MLYEVKKDRSTVPSPIIDVIMYDSLEYRQANPQVSASIVGMSVGRLLQYERML